MKQGWILAGLLLSLPLPAAALTYTGDAFQFAGGFNPRNASHGGFGGGSCTAAQYDYDFSDWTIYNTGGGDLDGVGHFRSKNNTGVIQRNMITGTCTGTGCCSGYGFSCVN